VTLHEIVKKLVGKINPVGETNTDNARYENLKVMTGLVDNLLVDINTVALNNKNKQEEWLQKNRTGLQTKIWLCR